MQRDIPRRRRRRRCRARRNRYGLSLPCRQDCFVSRLNSCKRRRRSVMRLGGAKVRIGQVMVRVTGDLSDQSVVAKHDDEAVRRVRRAALGQDRPDAVQRRSPRFAQTVLRRLQLYGASAPCSRPKPDTLKPPIDMPVRPKSRVDQLLRRAFIGGRITRDVLGLRRLVKRRAAP